MKTTLNDDKTYTAEQDGYEATADTAQEAQADLQQLINLGQPQPSYFETAVIHQLHRTWELQALQLMMLATTEEDKQAIQTVIDHQLNSNYATDMPW
jgi:hypothetical protein